MRAFGWPRVRQRWLDTVLPPDYARQSADLVFEVLGDSTPRRQRVVINVPDRGPLEVLRCAFPLRPVAGETEMAVIVYQHARSLLERLPDDDDPAQI